MFRHLIAISLATLSLGQLHAQSTWNTTPNNGINGTGVGNNRSSTTNSGGRARVQVFEKQNDADSLDTVVGTENQVINARTDIYANTFASAFDAMRQLDTTGDSVLPSKKGSLYGVIGRCIAFADKWTNEPWTMQNPPVRQDGYGGSFAAGFFKPYSDPVGSEAAPTKIGTGLFDSVIGVAGSIIADNSHFTDDVGTYTIPSIAKAVAVKASYKSGFFANAVESDGGTAGIFGGLTESFRGVEIETILNAAYDASAAAYVGSFDQIEDYVGIYVAPPVKNINAGTTAADQQTIANKSILSSVGIKIPAPQLPTAGTSSEVKSISPDNYIGLINNAKSELNGDTKIKLRRVAESSLTSLSGNAGEIIAADTASGVTRLYVYSTSGSWIPVGFTSETDTLQSVTARGDTTNKAVFANRIGTSTTLEMTGVTGDPASANGHQWHRSDSSAYIDRRGNASLIRPGTLFSSVGEDAGSWLDEWVPNFSESAWDFSNLSRKRGSLAIPPALFSTVGVRSLRVTLVVQTVGTGTGDVGVQIRADSSAISSTYASTSGSESNHLIRVSALYSFDFDNVMDVCTVESVVQSGSVNVQTLSTERPNIQWDTTPVTLSVWLSNDTGEEVNWAVRQFLVEVVD